MKYGINHHAELQKLPIEDVRKRLAVYAAITEQEVEAFFSSLDHLAYETKKWNSLLDKYVEQVRKTRTLKREISKFIQS